MDNLDKKITISLNEHDFALVLAVIQAQADQDNDVWKPSWLKLAHTIEYQVEEFLKRSYQKDMRATKTQSLAKQLPCEA